MLTDGRTIAGLLVVWLIAGCGPDKPRDHRLRPSGSSVSEGPRGAEVSPSGGPAAGPDHLQDGTAPPARFLDARTPDLPGRDPDAWVAVPSGEDVWWATIDEAKNVLCLAHDGYLLVFDGADWLPVGGELPFWRDFDIFEVGPHREAVAVAEGYRMVAWPHELPAVAFSKCLEARGIGSAERSLHEAARGGDVERATSILADREVDVDVPDLGGQTALHLAAARDHSDVVRVLVSHGALLEPRDDQLFTPIHRAAQIAGVETLAVLLEAGVDAGTQAGDGQWTPLHLVAQTILSEDAPCVEAARLLVGHGASVRAVDAEGKTPVDHASKRPNKPLTLAFLRSVED